MVPGEGSPDVDSEEAFPIHPWTYEGITLGHRKAFVADVIDVSKRLIRIDASSARQGAEAVPSRSTEPSSPPGSTRLATAARTSELRIQRRRPVMKSTTPPIETT